MKSIILLGATGNIGLQTIEVINENNDFLLIGISIGHNLNRGLEILKEFPSIRYAYIIDKNAAFLIRESFPNVTVYFGEDGLKEMIHNHKADIIVNALVGFAGLIPTIEALKNNQYVALANKEALVVGGELVNDLLTKGYGQLFPIDSEHSAIHKCLAVSNENVEKLILTASGGAFKKYQREETANLSAKEALKHPTWNMGAKITIDCATMMNKCFEVIEAHYLFDYPYDKISILLHDESMIHSMVKYKDGIYRAEISHPDMKNPIRYALYDGKITFDTSISKDYHRFGDYHFHRFTFKRYPLVRWAKKVIEEKGILGAVLNASNEVAVQAYLNGEIKFLEIDKVINTCMNETQNIAHPSLEIILDVDKKTRARAREIINNLER